MNKFCKHKTQPIHIDTDIISTFAGTNTQPIRLPAQENTYVKHIYKCHNRFTKLTILNIALK